MSPRNLVLGAALVMVVILVMLVVLIVVLWCYKKAQPQHEWATFNHYGAQHTFNSGQASIGNAGAISQIYASELDPQSYNGQAFVDPAYYDDSEKILYEFADGKEIFPQQIEFKQDSDIGLLSSGQFGMDQIQLATLHVGNRSAAAVVKFCNDQNERELRAFAIEVGVMSQFNHASVLLLYGIQLQGGPLLMCQEYTEGPLNMYLASRTTQTTTGLVHNCTTMQIIHLMRGIASGMQYLSEIAYVHKVLSASTVMISGQGVCKIAGFDIRAQLEMEDLNDSRIFTSLLPWASPEVATHRKHSSASDVFAFGTLMWQMLTPGCPMPFNPHAPEAIKKLCNGEVIQLETLPSNTHTNNQSDYITGLMSHCRSAECVKGKRPAFAQICQKLECVIRSPQMLQGVYSDNYEYFYPGKVGLTMYHTGSANQTPSMKQKTTNENNNQIDAHTLINSWLTSMKLDQYQNIFYEHGYERVGDLITLNSEAFEALGISSKNHRKKMVTSLQEISSKSHMGKDSAVHMLI